MASPPYWVAAHPLPATVVIMPSAETLRTVAVRIRDEVTGSVNRHACRKIEPGPRGRPAISENPSCRCLPSRDGPIGRHLADAITQVIGDVRLPRLSSHVLWQTQPRAGRLSSITGETSSERRHLPQSRRFHRESCRRVLAESAKYTFPGDPEPNPPASSIRTCRGRHRPYRLGSAASHSAHRHQGNLAHAMVVSIRNVEVPPRSAATPRIVQLSACGWPAIATCAAAADGRDPSVLGDLANAFVSEVRNVQAACSVSSNAQTT